MTHTKLKPPAIIEIVFDLAYLIFAATAGIIMLTNANGSEIAIRYGWLALILGFGDAFHLLPRVYSLWTDTMDQHVKALGLGKMITSVTMTLFYVLLYSIWQGLYQTVLPGALTIFVYLLALIRVILSIFPMSQWVEKESSVRFGIYRNIPFVLLGVIVAVLYAISGLRGYHDGFEFMAVAIALSFFFYLIVVLFAGKNKKLGALMLPKTCAYIWIICMGFHLLP